MKKAFTLIEVLVVVAILAILLAVVFGKHGDVCTRNGRNVPCSSIR